MDLKLRDGFSKLLEDTLYRNLCWQYMSSYIINRAFMYGKNTFTNKKFSQYFRQYYKLVKDISTPSFIRFFITRQSMDGIIRQEPYILYYKIQNKLLKELNINFNENNIISIWNSSRSH